MKFSAYNAFLIVLFTAFSFSSKAQIAVGFTADVTSGCAPLVVHFTNTSTGPVTGYFWDFGTGTTSGLKDASTSFTTPGTYTVSLTIYGPGGPLTITMTITVYPPPTVSFTASPTSVCPGTPVAFTSSTIAGVPGAVTYIWSFGDGGVSTAASPTHVYTTSGYFNVSLTATNATGCVASITVPKYIFVYTPAVPDFSASNTNLCKAPGTTIFTNHTTGTPGFTYLWDFGDGSTSTLTNPAHTYTSSGTFSVKLTVIDGNGCSSNIIKPGYILVGSFAAGFIPVTATCVNSVATFTDTSTTHTSANWDFGDGGAGTGDPGSHYYTTVGTYTVTLIISDGTCADTVAHTITILPAPSASIIVAPIHPCPTPAGVTFTALAPPGTLFTWDFGDTTVAAGNPVLHTYTTTGARVVSVTATDPITGCNSTETIIDTVFDSYWHYLSAHPDSGCAPLKVSFFDTSISHIPWGLPFTMPYPFPGISYSWIFGDGATLTTAYPATTHTYTAAGTYTVHISYTTTNGCFFTDSLLVLVGDAPVITASSLTPNQCYRKALVFYKKIIKGPVDDYLWTLSPGYTYYDYDTTGDTARYSPVPGTYRVTVTPVYHGCPGLPISLGSVTVDSPRSSFSYKILCNPHDRVQFSDSSWGDDSRVWIFGDGTTSTAINPLHDYPSTGTYTVSLATYNVGSGCRDTSMYIVVLAYPSFSFAATRPVVCKDGIDTFVITPSGGYAISYTWIGQTGQFFPDTTILPVPPYILAYRDTAGISIRNTITDTFHIPGVFDAELIIVDQNFCIDTITKTNYITVAQPFVNFTTSAPVGCLPFTVTFTDASSDEPGISFSRYTWSFGDGGTSTVTTPGVSHTFTMTGSFYTQEIVTDNYGCIDSTVLPIVTVWQAHASFYASNLFPCVEASTNFIDTNAGVVSSYWTFGDGRTSTALSPSHTYTAAGTYTVTLAIVDIHGCTDTAVMTKYITVPKVTASFTQSDTFTICPPLLVNFISTGIGATGFSWDFGDGNISGSANPSDLYIKPGYYTVTLIDSDSYGCKDTATGHVNVYGYSGALSYGPILSGCTPLTIHFKAKISNVSSIIWDFSDGTTSAASLTDSITYTYLSPGTYIPKLILSDTTGCQNSTVGSDTIKVDKVYPNFTTIPDPVCVNTPVTFKDSSRSYFSNINTWAWTFTNGDVSTASAPPYTYSISGTYPVTLMVTDGWGCIDSIKKNVVVYPLPVITTSPDTLVCLLDSAKLTAYGGVSYAWNPTVNVSCPNCNPIKAAPSVVTTYTVTGTDIHGCMNTDTVTVFLKTKTRSHASGDTGICRYEVAQIHDSGGTRYTWTPGAGLTDPTSTDPYASPDFTTKYTAIAYLGSCIPDTQFVWINVYQIPTVDAGPDQRLVEGSTTQLQAKGTLVETYSWGEVSTLSCDSCANPVATMSVTTTYMVNVTSANGCKSADTVTIHIYCDKSQIFIPNTFTPNGDGENDVFYPRGKGISNIKSFRIYNRWGQLLFERSDIQINDASNAWDGSYQGGTPKPDVYVYVLDAICETGEPINIKGDVTVIR